jgi:DNA-binding response OmpR family regulator
MAVMRLREKLHDDAGQPRFIETVRGVGYRFAGDRID